MNHNRFRLMADQQEHNKDNGLWKHEDVAAYLRIAPQTVRNWVKAKKIPFLKIGGVNRFDPDAIRDWAQEKKVDRVA